MRPPDYDLVNDAGEVVAEVAIATGGATGREGHLSLLVPDGTTILPGRYTLRHRETGRVAVRFTADPEVIQPEEHGDIAQRLTLSSKP